MAWNTSPARSRRAPPVGFIQPCQPTLVGAPPAGPGWLHEMKHDGYRLLARKDANRVRLWTRYGTDFTGRLPAIADAVRSPHRRQRLIDGEVVVFRPDGHSDFAALRTRAGGEQAALVAFDLLSLDADDMRECPLEERREALARLVAVVDGVRFSAALTTEGATVFAHACQLGLEGIVSKRVGSRYRSGPSRNWLKCLNLEFRRRPPEVWERTPTNAPIAPSNLPKTGADKRYRPTNVTARLGRSVAMRYDLRLSELLAVAVIAGGMHYLANLVGDYNSGGSLREATKADAAQSAPFRGVRRIRGVL
jgi:bifunctional non-homologous end joining protein LigD